MHLSRSISIGRRTAQRFARCTRGRAAVPLLLSLLAARGSGQVASLSYTGTLATPQSVFTAAFKLAAADTITFVTFGFGGGVNASGQTIPAGGFDPLIALFTGTATAAIFVDGSGNPLADADNLSNPPWSYTGNCPTAGKVTIGANQDCGDVRMQVALPAGTYTLLLTDANYQPAALYYSAGLSGPFVDLTGGNAQFMTCDPGVNTCITPNGRYALDIVSSRSSLFAITRCDINQDGVTNVSDVQLEIGQALGVILAANPLSGGGVVKVADVQIEINAALGLGCSAQ